MDRREALRLLAGSAALAGLTPSQLVALVERGQPRSAPRAFFTREQRAAVDALADAIIPATDTPGALDAGVTDFIEVIVSEWYDAAQRERFMRALAQVDERAVARTGGRFAVAPPESRTAILGRLEEEGAALLRSRAGSGDGGPPPFFHQLRSLVLHGYYTSEVGMRDELLFRRMPGSYEGCVDVGRVTRPVPGGGRG